MSKPVIIMVHEKGAGKLCVKCPKGLKQKIKKGAHTVHSKPSESMEFFRSFRRNIIAVNRSVYAGGMGRTDFDHFKLCCNVL